MKTLPVIFAAVIIFSFNTFAQESLPSNADIGQTQKWLEKNLEKKAKDIEDVRFEGCRLFVRQITVGNSYVNSDKTLGPSGSVNGFPRDDSSNYLSGGSSFEQSPTPYRAEKFLLDLTGLEADKITIRSARNKNKVIISFQTDKENVISLVTKKKAAVLKNYGFVVDKDKQEFFVEALKQAVGQCK
jgi:hypothetical protein